MQNFIFKNCCSHDELRFNILIAINRDLNSISGITTLQSSKFGKYARTGNIVNYAYIYTIFEYMVWLYGMVMQQWFEY